MRQAKVWRYWCDHCRKGGCGKAAMARHELRCIRNPARACGMCKAGELEQQAMPVLLAAYDGYDLPSLRRAANGCPACMLATVVQAGHDHDREEIEWFDYKAESASFWADVNSGESYPPYLSVSDLSP